MLDGVGADQRDLLVAERAGRPHRTELRVDEVGAATRVRDLVDVDQRRELLFLRVDHRDLVGLVRCRHEVALGAVPAAVVQEARGADRRGLEVVDVLVVDQQDLPGLLDVDDELRMLVRGDDRGHARLRMELLRVDGHAARRDHLQRLERRAVHDRVLRRPVGAGDRVLVLVALVLRRLDRACLEADLDLGDAVRHRHVQVDQVDAAVAADRVHVAARVGQARDVHRVARLDHVDDLLGVAVDQRHLAGVTQRDREDVVEVELVLLRRRPLLDRDQHLPGVLDLLHAPFRRLRRLVLHEARHDVDLVRRELAGLAPARHAGGRALVDEDLEVLGALGLGDVRRQRLARRALAQHAVAAGAALEVDLLRVLELGHGHVRRAGRDADLGVRARRPARPRPGTAVRRPWSGAASASRP